jgi:hypothetical protein
LEGIRELQNIEVYFEDRSFIEGLKFSFEYLLDDKKTAEEILELHATQAENKTQFSVLLYLIASLKSNNLRAFQLHIALIARLEMISTKVVATEAPYKFLVVPFFEDFWQDRIQKNPTEFFEYSFLLKKGILKFQNKDPRVKLRKMFQVLAYHLHYDMSEKEEEWYNAI